MVPWLGGEEMAAAIPDDTPDPERHALAQNRLQIVLDLAEALPPRCREIFALRKLEGSTRMRSPRGWASRAARWKSSCATPCWCWPPAWARSKAPCDPPFSACRCRVLPAHPVL
jgi:hypothetical protein